jgi:hypothetical protein
VAYQVARQGQREAMAWFDPLVMPDPEAWLADRLGPLAWCRPDQPLADPPGEAVLMPVVPDCVPGLPPEVIHRPPPPVAPPIEVLMPPAELLTVRGPGRRPVVVIEAPRHGPIMGVQLVTLAGPAPWLLLARPPDPDDVVVVPHPAFLPPSTPQRMPA